MPTHDLRELTMTDSQSLLQFGHELPRMFLLLLLCELFDQFLLLAGNALVHELLEDGLRHLDWEQGVGLLECADPPARRLAPSEHFPTFRPGQHVTASASHVTKLHFPPTAYIERLCHLLSAGAV